MKKIKKPLIGLSILLGVFVVFAIIYRAIYSMDKAIDFEVNDKNSETRLLIATQGSDFKNELVNILIDSLKKKPVYIQVRDISVLPETRIEDWSAIVVIHTWEYSAPPKEVSVFSSKIESTSPVVFFTTSGDGAQTLKKVDAISGASKQHRTSHYLRLLLDKLKPLILPDSIDQSHIVH